MEKEGISEKVRLREQFRKYRSGLEPSRYASASREICRRLMAMPVVQSAGTIHSFWPSVAKREVDIRPALNHFVGADKILLLPVLDRDAPGRLRHVRFHKEAAMTPNKWGIHEPAGSAFVPPDQADVVIVPALCVTRDGRRIGYGKGYYDRFLSEIAAPTVAPVFAEAIVDNIPSEPHDMQVDWIVTETETIFTGANATSV